MKRRMRRLIRALGLTVVACLLLTSCSSSSGGVKRGPSWGPFSATWPSSPTTASSGQMRVLTLGRSNLSGSAGYFVGSPATLFQANPPVPKAGTYIVQVLRFTRSIYVTELLAVYKAVSGAQSTTAGNFRGVRLITKASNSPLAAAGAKVLDPNAYVGFMFVINGDLGYIVADVTATQAEAAAFLNSFKPST
jgi:hypothetical protein